MKFKILNVVDKETGRTVGKKFLYRVFPFIWRDPTKRTYRLNERLQMEHDMIFCLYLDGKVCEKDVFV